MTTLLCPAWRTASQHWRAGTPYSKYNSCQDTLHQPHEVCRHDDHRHHHIHPHNSHNDDGKRP